IKTDYSREKIVCKCCMSTKVRRPKVISSTQSTCKVNNKIAIVHICLEGRNRKERLLIREDGNQLLELRLDIILTLQNLTFRFSRGVILRGTDRSLSHRIELRHVRVEHLTKSGEKRHTRLAQEVLNINDDVNTCVIDLRQISRFESRDQFLFELITNHLNMLLIALRLQCDGRPTGLHTEGVSEIDTHFVDGCGGTLLNRVARIKEFIARVHGNSFQENINVGSLDSCPGESYYLWLTVASAYPRKIPTMIRIGPIIRPAIILSPPFRSKFVSDEDTHIYADKHINPKDNADDHSAILSAFL